MPKQQQKRCRQQRPCTWPPSGTVAMATLLLCAFTPFAGHHSSWACVPTQSADGGATTLTTTTSTSTSTSTSTTTTTTTTVVCVCPAGTSGIIFTAGDARIFQFNMPGASATCAGCPAGLTQSCYPTQPDSNPANDIADVDVQCGANGVPDYSMFCACPSDGTQCYTFGQNNAVQDVQIFTFCDAGGTCLSYLVFFSNDNSDFINNNVHTVSFIGQTDGAGNLVPFSTNSPYVKAPTLAVSCDGCNGISTTNANTGTGVTCAGPLTTTAG